MSSLPTARRPFVSVIIPVYNGKDHIRTCIESLLAQDYPKDQYEIIIIDNNSTDDTPSIIQSYPVIFLSETKQGSYAARNRGIGKARGEILAFTDADCCAYTDWISSGVRCIADGAANFVGGSVAFSISPQRTAAEQWDALTGLDNKAVIAEKGAAVTANIFAPRSMFDKIGLFHEVQSGGDFEWTIRAKKFGYKIAFCEKAIVKHPARKLRELLRMNRRVGAGIQRLWRDTGEPWYRIWLRMGVLALPFVCIHIPRILRTKGSVGARYSVIRIAFVAYLTRLAQFVGIVISLVRKDV